MIVDYPCSCVKTVYIEKKMKTNYNLKNLFGFDPFIRLYRSDLRYFSSTSLLLGTLKNEAIKEGYHIDNPRENQDYLESIEDYAREIIKKDSDEDSKVVSATATVLDRKEVTPVVIYPNADIDKQRILAENLRVKCVYR